MQSISSNDPNHYEGTQLNNKTNLHSNNCNVWLDKNLKEEVFLFFINIFITNPTLFKNKVIDFPVEVDEAS